MNINYNELGLQMLVGGLTGALAVFAATNELTPAIWSLVIVGVVRGVAQVLIDYLKPKTVSLRYEHYTDKMKRVF